eukprot:2884223-Prymnesium_polylepis.1
MADAVERCLRPVLSKCVEAAGGDELRQLRTNNQKLESEIRERDAQMISQAKILAAVRQESANAKAECAAVIAECDELRAQLQKLTTEHLELEEVAAAAKMENAMLQAEGGQLRHELRQLGSPNVGNVRAA